MPPDSTPGHGDRAEEPLEARWRSLMQRLGLHGDFDEILQALAVKGGEDALEQRLSRLNRQRHRAADADGLELALWFCGGPAAPGREAPSREVALDSALYFDRMLGIHLPTRRADAVHALIMAAAGGDGARDSALLRDCLDPDR